MSEIKNLETRINNAILWKSPYFRINVSDANLLLAEINSLRNTPKEIVYIKDEPKVIFATMDGGGF